MITLIDGQGHILEPVVIWKEYSRLSPLRLHVS